VCPFSHNYTSTYTSISFLHFCFLSILPHIISLFLSQLSHITFFSSKIQNMTTTEAAFPSDLTRIFCNLPTCRKLAAEDVKLSRCSSCKSVFYCSTQCQRSDWKKHKSVCNELKKLAESKEGYTRVVVKEAEDTSGKSPKKGNLVTIHWRGSLPNRAVFEDSRTMGDALEVAIGKKHLVRGLDEGIMTMQPGQIARFVISPPYGWMNPNWSASATPKITIDVPVIFEVELVSFRK
jgi:FKBP-type peptidyl-prolyl cis-trans isomerase